MARLGIILAMFAAALLAASAAQTPTANAQMLSFRSTGDAPGSGRRTRVQADLARKVDSWQGVRDCGSAARARAALNPVLVRWLRAQTDARPGRRLALWGYHSGDIWTENRIADGKPACSAGFRKVIAYAVFG